MPWLPPLAGALLALAVLMPLAWKWQLGLRRVSVFAIAVSTLFGVLTIALGIGSNPWLQALVVAAGTIGLAFAVLAYRFYRDPEREIPDGDDVIVSPADGEVLYVRESVGGRLPVASKHGIAYTLQELTRTKLELDRAVVVGIAMSFLDVHVNRAPIAGRVRLRRHFPGRFGSLGKPGMVFENERATTVIERPDIEIAVVQIASRLVRQIAAYVDVGETVAAGDRIGVIRLGSQVDVVLPVRPGLEIAVQPGQRVRAGESILAKLAQ